MATLVYILNSHVLVAVIAVLFQLHFSLSFLCYDDYLHFKLFSHSLIHSNFTFKQTTDIGIGIT
jgi:type IV secretory pathway VirB3-like protein